MVSPGGALRWHVRSLSPVLVESVTAAKSSPLFLRVVVNVLLSKERESIMAELHERKESGVLGIQGILPLRGRLSFYIVCNSG